MEVSPVNQSPCPTASRNIAHIALVIFLAVLLLQSAFGLFFPGAESLDSIDIVLRSALSSIFGYLMSSVGQQSATESKSETSTTPRTIGFSANEDSTLSQLESAPSASSAPAPASKSSQRTAENPQFQTVIIACLGFFCLVILIALRYFGGNLPTTTGAIATVAQYRDIIAGSIGALIGLARGQKP